MSIAADTSRTLVIEGSPRQLLVIVGAGVLMTAVSLAVALQPSISDKIWGYLGAAFFGLCTVVSLWRLLISSRPVIAISPEGLRDTRGASALIPWSAVTGISTWEYFGVRTMVFAIKPGVEDRLGLTPVARWTRGANRALGADGLCVSASGLKIDYDTLLQTCMDYAHIKRDRPRQHATKGPLAPLPDAHFTALRLWALNTRASLWAVGIAIWPSGYTSVQNERLRTMAYATPPDIWLIWVLIFSVMWFVSSCFILAVAMLPLGALLTKHPGGLATGLVLVAACATMLSGYVLGSIIGSWIAGRITNALMPLPALEQAEGDTELFEATRRQIGRLVKHGLLSAGLSFTLLILPLLV